MGLTIKELIPIGEKILKDAGVEEYKIDAESLISFQIGFDKQKLFMNWTYDVDDARCEAYFDLVNRRAAGEPLQYITNEQYFMGHRLYVDPAVLIPRPETEALAEKAIEHLRAHPDVKAVLDLCTGSGALAISIAKACPHAKITAADVSEKALAVAMKNASALGAAGRIDFVLSDLFSGIKRGAFGKRFGLIVTNPPYIQTDGLTGLQREIRDHEPLMALDGGADGLDFYRRIAAEAPGCMRSGACIMAETGWGQAHDAAAIFEAAGFTGAGVFKDLAGRDRIIMMHWIKAD